ncbi:TetR/AcrR family transcriptional regulator [Henriciella aquimarina]|uniref:TetR/AcrR family transcriptional regulator n=1 Tax=Henriciella aquimarina TaxID=545261 RepID=UPI0009FFA6BB|nr:TetR/AcrR family transcriptional regulator [Henriciella aquimarina]
MPRPSGVRNQDFAEKRQALLDKVEAYVLEKSNELPSFRQLAIAAAVSEPTLRHYFKDRSGLIIALIGHFHKKSEFMREATRQSGDGINASLEDYHRLLHSFRNETIFIEAQAFMIRESMVDPAVRKAYLEQIVEPSLDALAQRLLKTEGGPATEQTARTAAMMLLSSSMFMIVHQELLDGKEHTPIDETQYFQLIRNWMRNGLKHDPEGSGLE